MEDSAMEMTAEQEAERDAAIDAGLAEGAAATQRWLHVWRAANVAAAQAIAARDRAAKRAAIAVVEQAAARKEAIVCAIFGARDVPAQYAPLELAGRSITREQVNAALVSIRADGPAKKGRRK